MESIGHIHTCIPVCVKEEITHLEKGYTSTPHCPKKDQKPMGSVCLSPFKVLRWSLLTNDFLLDSEASALIKHIPPAKFQITPKKLSELENQALPHLNQES